MSGEHNTGEGPRAQPLSPETLFRTSQSAPVRPLLTEAGFRQLLGGMSERKFKELRAEGIVGAPLELGPRVARWTYGDFEDTIQRLPRRTFKPEPESLASGRRKHVDLMKAGGAT